MAVSIFHSRHLNAVDDKNLLPFFDEQIRVAAKSAIEHYDVPDLAPIILDENWSITEGQLHLGSTLRGWLDAPSSAEAYAREIDSFCQYLETVRHKKIEDVESADFFAYKRFRREGPPRVRLKNRSWNKVAAALLMFCEFLGKTFKRITWKKLRASVEADTSVRMIDIPTYAHFFEGLTNSSRWRQRNAAFSELLITSGMRCSEAGALLKQDVLNRGQFGSHRAIELTLPAAICKRSKSRKVHYSRRVAAHHIWPYIDEERAYVVHQFLQHAFPKETYSAAELDCFEDEIFYEATEPGKIRIIAGKLDKAVVDTAKLSIEERRRLIEVERSSGRKFKVIDLGSLWVTERGTTPCNATWRLAFKQACDWVNEGAAGLIHVTPHTLRHTYAVIYLSALIKDLLTRHRDLDLGAAIYAGIVGDPLRKLQVRLGHGSLDSTHKYLTYLGDAQEEIDRCLSDWATEINPGLCTMH